VELPPAPREIVWQEIWDWLEPRRSGFDLAVSRVYRAIGSGIGWTARRLGIARSDIEKREDFSAIEIGALKGALSSFSPEHLHLNGAGDFVIGGPRGDNGLSGKKLVVDHYGPSVPIGGGALCGKDVWKVDRCGPLRARQLAKRLVRSGHHEAKVVLGWAPGEDIPSLRDVLVRDQPDTPWREADPVQVPLPRWFAIESIVNDLELTRVNWTELPITGTFTGPLGPWEQG
jgi:S-adenosylmethionine synthetase